MTLALLNTFMKYLMPAARNTVTGQTIKQQDLSGVRYTQSQRWEVQQHAEQLAQSLTARTKDTWQAVVQEYTL